MLFLYNLYPAFDPKPGTNFRRAGHEARRSGCWAWHPKAVVSLQMGREDAPRRLRRKDGFIFLPCFRPAEAAGAHPPKPRSTSGWVAMGKKHYGLARGLPHQVSPMSVYNLIKSFIPLDKGLENDIKEGKFLAEIVIFRYAVPLRTGAFPAVDDLKRRGFGHRSSILIQRRRAVHAHGPRGSKESRGGRRGSRGGGFSFQWPSNRPGAKPAHRPVGSHGPR